MGCAASKLDNEDTVRRCKERRRLIKDAVYARHHLASAHSDYLHSLRLTGSALSTFAQHQPLLSVSNNTPAAILLNTSPPHAPPSSFHAPPRPPPPPFSTSESPTMSSSKLPHILSESEAPLTESRRPPRAALPRRRKQPPPKLPHILSESSLASTPRSQKSGYFYPTAYQAVDSTYASTPSQASSVWNWENFYPPSPPDSEFFEKKARSRENLYRNDGGFSHHLDADDEKTETERSEYDFFNPYGVKQKGSSVSGSGSVLGTGLNSRSVVGEETEREEVECSDWGDHDHYNTTSSSDVEGQVERETGLRSRSRSEIGSRSNYESSPVRGESVVGQPVTEARPHEGLKYGSLSSKSEEKSDDVQSMGSYRTGEISDMKMVVRHKNLKEIVDALKENFEKAASAGDQVSEMLEIGRAQLDRSFRQLKSKSSKGCLVK